MSDRNERQAAAEAELADIKREARDEELEQSAERRAARGWPIQLEDGSEVMVVEKVSTPNRDAVRAEDGTEYERTTNPLVWEKSGAVMTDAEADEVHETGTEPTEPAPESLAPEGDATPGAESPAETAADPAGEVE